MSDNVLEPAPQDDERVNVLAGTELEYGTRQLRVNRAQLAAAIEQAGPAIANLRRVPGDPSP